MAATSNEPVTLLKTAVAHATDYINNHNIAPQDALHKISEEFDLSPNFIKRASEAINVGLSHSHFKKHASSRDAEFAITDADKVVKSIFGTALKTASEVENKHTGMVDNFGINLHKLTNSKYKTAYAEMLSTKDDEQTMSPRGVVEKSALFLSKLEKNAEAARDDLVDAEFRMKTAFANIVNGFSVDQENQQSWADFEKQAFAETGPKAVPFIEHIFKAAGFKDTTPRGDTKHIAVNYTPSKQVVKFADFMRIVDEVAEFSKKADVASAEYNDAKNHVQETFQQIGRAKLASLYNTNSLTFLEEIAAEKKAEDEAEKKAEEIDPVLNEASRREKVAEEAKNLWHSLAQSIDFGKNARGAASAQNDNAKRQQILTSIISTDPILSQENPHDVVKNYQQMVHLSPELSLQEEVVRGQLRQMAAGQALNPHDASLLSGANNEMLKTHQLRQPQHVQGSNSDKKK